MKDPKKKKAIVKAKATRFLYHYYYRTKSRKEQRQMRLARTTIPDQTLNNFTGAMPQDPRNKKWFFLIYIILFRDSHN